MNIIRRSENKPAALTSPDRHPFSFLHELLRWDPFREIAPLVSTEGRDMIFVPDVDIKESPGAYVFKADLPGMAEKDVEVSLIGNRLTLSGKREQERREEKDTYYACERFYGTFTRTFSLPAGTDPDRIAAELKNGVLTISVPKRPEVQPKKVPVQAAPEKKN
jgi:HSP20 family protein